MGKKKIKSGSSAPLGRSLIKDRFGNSNGKKMVSDNSMLHTTEIHDGYDWGRLNLQSVTEESTFQEFLSTAELAGTEFQAEKLNVKFVNPRSNVGLLSGEELKSAKNAHEKYKEVLKIPRRPAWNSNTTAEELDKNEKENFLEWRRSLAHLQEEQGILLTPYEKNLEFWRQLWRVVERSDVIVQIVDARNPLLFRCEDLEKYTKEVSNDKINLILANKADFLTEHQREYWAEYFSSLGVHIVFFSAHLAVEEISVRRNENDYNGVTENDERKDSHTQYQKEATDYENSIRQDNEEENKKEGNDNENLKGDVEDLKSVKKSIADLECAVEENANVLRKIINRMEKIVGRATFDECKTLVENSSHLLTREELIHLFKIIHEGPKVKENITTIGLVGYPNVGKSSTINALLSSKKVSVSATPGKTKHFQTLYLERDILLCDCPGLVMPSFVFTKAEMILNGILPIDQMRDHVPPVNLVTSLIPRHVLEDKYGIMLPAPMEGEDPDRPPIAEELLNAYAYNRGFMTANGQPDNPRASRYILKDYVNGKLLYCHAPPNVDQKVYHTWPKRQKVYSENRTAPPRAVRAVKPYHSTTEDIDKAFFKSASQGVHAKGVLGFGMTMPNTEDLSQRSQSGTEAMEKPWKQYNRHKNKGKKEKLRKVYAHLDQH